MVQGQGAFSRIQSSRQIGISVDLADAPLNQAQRVPQLLTRPLPISLPAWPGQIALKAKGKREGD